MKKSGIALSPDGRQLAFVVSKPGRAVLSVMPAAGGPVREVAQKKSMFRNMLAWAADGRRLLFGTIVNSAKRDVWLVSAAGGEPRKLDLEMDKMNGFTMRPDGKRIAFTADGYDNEVWVLENFLRELRTAK